MRRVHRGFLAGDGRRGCIVGVMLLVLPGC